MASFRRESSPLGVLAVGRGLNVSFAWARVWQFVIGQFWARRFLLRRHLIQWFLLQPCALRRFSFILGWFVLASGWATNRRSSIDRILVYDRCA